MDITAIEFARRLGLSRQWVCEVLRDGRVEGARKVGRVWFVPEDATMPEAEPPGKAPASDGARAERAERREQRAKAFESVPIRGTRQPHRRGLSPREQWVNQARDNGLRIVGRWVEIIEFQEWYGPAWMEGETAEQFKVRQMAWDNWKNGAAAMPEEFAKFIGG